MTREALNTAVHISITALSLLVLAVNCLAQSDQKVDIEFHAPFRTSVADSSQEFRDKYFLGDWMGERPKLAHRGIQFALLSIIDPFGNVTGGKLHCASDYNLVAFGVVLYTDRLLGWHGGTIHVGYASISVQAFPRITSATAFPYNLQTLPMHTPA